ncbi:IS1096 element passenger TnpR family protein, partial [Pedobacter sp.]|uniref:IS1096 element passenger TnpR family protein n=1 Tax=Pedobacter sp. TaxID=1411316 RepID=UPI003D7F29CD
RGVNLMENVKLSSLIEDPHQKFYYIYNFDRPFDFHVELIKIILETDPNIQYPYLFKSTGEAPKIFDKNNPDAVAATASTAVNEFDFLNELDVVPEDTEELEAMGGTGINEKEKGDDEEDQDEDAFSDDEDYEDEGYGGGKDDDY